VPIKSFTVDEGTLTLGTGLTAFDMTAQVRTVAIDFSEDVEDDRKTLSGETLPGKATYPATLSGTVIQDLSDEGLTEYTWTNKGTVVSFVLSPNDASGRQITGSVRVGPLKVGGDVGEDGPEAEFEWGCIGDPVLGAALV
jgi:hypothetical protein